MRWALGTLFVLAAAGCTDMGLGVQPDGAQLADLSPSQWPDLSPWPDLSMPDLAQPDLSMPDLAQPDLSIPDLARPDLAQPDLSMPDLAVSDLVGPVDLGQGFASFEAPVLIAIGAGTGTLVAGDWNADGLHDLALCNVNSSKLQVLLGKGDGTFTVVRDAATSCHFNMTAALVDNDQRLDIVVGAALGADVLLSKGDGTFSVVSLIGPNANSNGSHVVGDFNKDGSVDVVTLKTAQAGSSALQFFAGNGNGTFKAGVAGDISFANHDLNYLGWDGVQLGGRYTGAGPGYNFEYYKWNGNGTFSSFLQGNGGWSEFSRLFPIDRDRNGVPETYGWIANKGGSDITVWNVAFWKGTPTFGDGLDVGDFNGDGALDAVVASSKLYFENGANKNGEVVHGTIRTASSVAVRDFNRDGKDDVAVLVTNPDGVDILLSR